MDVCLDDVYPMPIINKYSFNLQQIKMPSFPEGRE